ncbi:MAG: hypothetical protein ACC645_27790, partial [Pirellulales bacterium]
MAIWAIVSVPSARAQTNAVWNGSVDTSYSNAANWDIGVVPTNDLVNQYNVFVPAGQTVDFDVDGISEITDLTLASGSTLTISPGETLNVLDDAQLAGDIATSAGTFVATGLGAQFQGNGFSVSVSGTGSIQVAAPSYTNTLDDVRKDFTFLSA